MVRPVSDEIQELFDEPPQRMNIRALLVIGALIVLTVVVIAILASGGGSADALAFLRVDAEPVEVAEGSPVDFGVASDGQALDVGDSVRTDDAGRARIEFFDSSEVRLDGNTAVVISALADDLDGRGRIIQDLLGGRTWNRVNGQGDEAVDYQVRFADAHIRVGGTTFVIDCRRLPRCFLIGIEGEAIMSSSVAEQTKWVNEPGECAELLPDGTTRDCDPWEEGLIDDWFMANLNADQRSIPTPTPQPTPPPTPVPTPRPAPTPAPTPEPTPEETETPEPETPSPDPNGNDDEGEEDDEDGGNNGGNDESLFGADRALPEQAD